MVSVSSPGTSVVTVTAPSTTPSAEVSTDTRMLHTPSLFSGAPAVIFGASEVTDLTAKGAKLHDSMYSGPRNLDSREGVR